MEHPSPARSAPSRPTRELTLAEVFDPQTFTRSRRRFGAIRACAIYCLHEVEGAPHSLIALGRDYKPLGTRTPSGCWVDYARFPAHHCRMDQLNLDAGPGDGTRWLTSPAGRSWFLWSDRTVPYATAAGLTRYRLALLDVLGPDGLAWIARLAGRELGDFPDRATCYAALLAEIDPRDAQGWRRRDGGPTLTSAPALRRPERRAIQASGAEQKAGDDCREAPGVTLPRQLEVGGAPRARVVAMPAPPNPLLNSYEARWLARLAAESGTPPDRIVRTALYTYLRRKAPHLDPRLERAAAPARGDEGVEP